MKIYILGASGSGKSTLSKKLSKILNISYFDLDNIFWHKKYTSCNIKEHRSKLLNNILRKKNWIIEGVYTTWTKEVIDKSDLVIWLDINKYLIIFRIIKRYIFNKFKSVDRNKEITIKNSLKFIKNAYKYEPEKEKNNYCRGYCEHKRLVKGFSKKYIVIKNNKDELELIRKIKMQGTV